MTAPISASLMPAAEISWREDLMSMPHCDTRSYPRQYVPVFARPHTPSQWQRQREELAGPKGGSIGPSPSERALSERKDLCDRLKQPVKARAG